MYQSGTNKLWQPRSHRKIQRPSCDPVERREWILWCFAILVTLLLTAGIASFVAPMLHEHVEDFDTLHINLAVRGLVGLVLLFDIYTIYQQLQIYRIRNELVRREELFRLISENAADMIAVVDADGKRLYNSPAYERILGYSAEELLKTSSLEQVHPDDRPIVEEAARAARTGGQGRTIQYRMRHKDGTWHVLESGASAVLNDQGQVEKLVIVNRDVSARKQLEEQFRQSQKMEAVGRLSGGSLDAVFAARRGIGLRLHDHRDVHSFPRLLHAELQGPFMGGHAQPLSTPEPAAG